MGKVTKFDRLFFCQAYNDISYILTSINVEQFENNLIIVVNNYNSYEFIEDLNIKNVQLYFITQKLKSLRNPITILDKYIGGSDASFSLDVKDSRLWLMQ